MSDAEKLLIMLLEQSPDLNVSASLLQTFISEYGPLSEEAAIEVRRLLHER